MKNNKNFGLYLRAIFYFNCYYNINRCGIFEKMTSFSQIGTRKINNRGKFSEIKVQEPRVSNVRNRLKLGKKLGKSYSVRKRKEMDIENFII